MESPAEQLDSCNTADGMTSSKATQAEPVALQAEAKIWNKVYTCD